MLRNRKATTIKALIEVLTEMVEEDPSFADEGWCGFDDGDIKITGGYIKSGAYDKNESTE